MFGYLVQLFLIICSYWYFVFTYSCLLLFFLKKGIYYWFKSVGFTKIIVIFFHNLSIFMWPTFVHWSCRPLYHFSLSSASPFRVLFSSFKKWTFSCNLQCPLRLKTACSRYTSPPSYVSRATTRSATNF